MSTIHQTPCRRHENDSVLSDAEIRRRVAEIRATWSPQERHRRAQLGRARREWLLGTLGIAPQKACA